MSVEVQAAVKPRISYSQFVAQQGGATLSALVEKFILEMDGTPGRKGVKPLGVSHRYTLRKACRYPIGSKVAATLTKHDFIDLVKALRADGIGPSTCQQYMTYLTGVLKYAPSAWDEHEDVNPGAIEIAKPFLQKLGYISKSVPRERRPQPEELERLLAFFDSQNECKRTKIDMVRITLWQLYSSRRIGESCKLLWSDWNREDQTILVRGMKDPRRKNKHKLVAIPPKAQALLVALYEIRDPSEPRIFPYNSKCCSKRYTEAKKALGIEGLRLHDSRRDCGTRLVEDDGYTPAQAILATGHETVQVFERTYLKQKPELFKNGPRRMAEATA